ncbi:unnamed protein product [Alopecurus aequalis]
METQSLFVGHFPPFVHRYEDGRVERLLTSSFVPASEDPAAGRGVATRDVVINRATGVSARLFLPLRAAAAGRRLPLVIYFHGGSFCTESAFCRTYNRYATSLAASSGALVVSVEFRLAPEHPIPAAYDDAWDSLRWASSPFSDPWIAAHADTQRAFLAGDSAGGNIVYHTAVRAAREGAGVLDLLGLIMVQPYFWGPEWLPAERVWDGEAVLPATLVDKLWPFVTGFQAGNDDPRINPPREEIATLRCRRVLVAVAEKDTLVHRGRALAARMRENRWIGDGVTLVESEGEDHGFHLYSPLRATSKRLMNAVVEFINQPPETIWTPPTAAALLDQHRRYTLQEFEGKEALTPCHWGLSLPTRPFHSIMASGADMGVGISSMPSNSLKITCHAKTTTKTRYAATVDRGSVNPLPATLRGTKSFF